MPSSGAQLLAPADGQVLVPSLLLGTEVCHPDVTIRIPTPSSCECELGWEQGLSCCKVRTVILEPESG